MNRKDNSRVEVFSDYDRASYYPEVGTETDQEQRLEKGKIDQPPFDTPADERAIEDER